MDIKSWSFALCCWCLLGFVAEAFGQDAPSRYEAAYPTAASKKGLQVRLTGDAIALGVKHAAMNINLSQLIDPKAAENSSDQPYWELDGRRYCFKRSYLERLDRDIRALSESGALVHLVVLTYDFGQPDVSRILLHPDYDASAPNRLGAFNTVTNEGRQWLTATMEFLAERWSRPDRKYGHVAGYIVGNEVNSHWYWSNRGRATMEEFADDYLGAVRLVHGAVRRQASWPRVYISLDHHWNSQYVGGDELQVFSGKAFIDYFAQQARKGPGGDFDWHVAYHPYPENLFEPRFWNDKSALSHENTPRITFKNLGVLTDYLQRDELLYNGKPRRVILSEQGFHEPDGDNGEAIQAAAYCYAYRKVAKLDGIDALILHRHVDHPNEGGLRLGLRRRDPGAEEPYPKRLIYDCFRAADTLDWEPSFEFALPIVGIKSWDEL